MMEELLFARIREDAVIPSKRVEDAGYDIYAASPPNLFQVCQRPPW